MNSIHKPPVIASSSNSFSFDFSSNFSLPPNSRPSVVSSSNTTNQDDTPEAQAGSQPTVLNPLACATHQSVPAPVLGTAASSISPPSPAKAQTDENGAPRDAVSTSLIGLKLQEDRPQQGTAVLPLSNADTSSSAVPPDVSLQPQGNEPMPPSTLPPTRVRGKKRKSIPAGDATAPPEPKKRRALSAKQKEKQKAIEVVNDHQVPPVPPQVDNSQVAKCIQQTQPSAVPRHGIPDQFTVPPTPPSRWVVNDFQHLQNLFASYNLTETQQVEINRPFPTRILDMMLTVFDKSDRTLKAYFVPYIWFSADLRRPYRLQQDDKYFWGQRLHEYHQRVQCGRIGYTVTGCPILFFTCEEKQVIDLINYNIILNAHRRITEAKARQPLPGLAVGNPASSNVQDSAYTSVPLEATISQPNYLSSTTLVNSSADLGLNNEANLNSEFSYNIPSVVQPGPPSQTFSALNNSESHEYQLSNNLNINDNNVTNINTDTSPDFIFNINDLPIIEETPSNEISHSFSGSAGLDPTTLFDTPQFNNDAYNEFEFDTDSFMKSFDDTSVASTLDPGPSNVDHPFSELEAMYMNLNWSDSQDAQPSAVASQY